LTSAASLALRIARFPARLAELTCVDGVFEVSQDGRRLGGVDDEESLVVTGAGIFTPAHTRIELPLSVHGARGFDGSASSKAGTDTDEAAVGGSAPYRARSTAATTGA